jgi:hypothetical protein
VEGVKPCNLGETVGGGWGKRQWQWLATAGLLLVAVEARNHFSVCLFLPRARQRLRRVGRDGSRPILHDTDGRPLPDGRTALRRWARELA